MNDKKKIYCLSIMDDFGELWLGHNKEPICFVPSDEAGNDAYLNGIFDYLNVELIYKEFHTNDQKLENRLYEEEGDEKSLAKLLKKEIDKL